MPASGARSKRTEFGESACSWVMPRPIQKVRRCPRNSRSILLSSARPKAAMCGSTCAGAAATSIFCPFSSPHRLVLEINTSECLSVMVAHDKAGFRFFDGLRRKVMITSWRIDAVARTGMLRYSPARFRSRFVRSCCADGRALWACEACFV